jgi:hypothetical protein
MMKDIVFGLILGVLVISQTLAQRTALERKNNIKLKLPLSLNGLGRDWMVVGVGYERLFTPTNTLSLGVNYYNSHRQYETIGGTRTQYQQVMVLPQWRHYFRKNKDNYFNGFHAGVSTAYFQDQATFIEGYRKRRMAGMGLLAGYQQVIKKRISLGLTPSLHYGLQSNQEELNGQQRRFFGSTFIFSLDFQAGFLF